MTDKRFFGIKLNVSSDIEEMKTKLQFQIHYNALTTSFIFNATDRNHTASHFQRFPNELYNAAIFIIKSVELPYRNVVFWKFNKNLFSQEFPPCVCDLLLFIIAKRQHMKIKRTNYLILFYNYFQFIEFFSKY